MQPHPSQDPARVEARLLAALKNGFVPSRALYDTPLQTARWLAYHQAYSPSRQSDALQASYREAFQTALSTGHIEPSERSGPFRYVSLGCGGGLKDSFLLRLAKDMERPVHYVPTDISAALVEEACRRARDLGPGITIEPIVLDLDARPPRSTFVTRSARDQPSIFSCFGIVPNFDDQALLPYLRSLTREGDLLLFSANLSPAPHPDAASVILPQYDNQEALAWYRAALPRLDIPEDAAKLDVRTRSLSPDGQVWRMECLLNFLRPVTLFVAGETLVYGPGDQLCLFFSNRFTTDAITDRLDAADFCTLWTHVAPNKEEGIYLTAPKLKAERHG